MRSLSSLAAALEPLRATGDANALADAVAAFLTSDMAVLCRVDRAHDGALALAARRVAGARVDLADPSTDLGEHAARSATFDVIADPERRLSWIVVPLLAPPRTVGCLRLALPSSFALSATDLGPLRDIGTALAAGLAAAELHEQAESVSQSLQHSLLPTALPQADWFEIAGSYLPATAGLHVGGDWYDAELLPSGELALSVGDVAGHGVEAAARMGEIRSAIAALRLFSRLPDELIGLLHRVYARSGYFATATCARVAENGTLRWASAGHVPPIIARATGRVELMTGGQSPPLGTGIGDGVPLNQSELTSGDTVLLFTDGLVERRDERLDQSLARLVRHVAAAPSTAPLRLVDHVVATRQASGTTDDDIAVLAARLAAAADG